jgi:hypothetical protein
VKHRIGLYFIAFFLFGFLLATTNAIAQTVAYRQTNLASNLPNVASGVSPDLVNPWGTAFLSGQPFLISAPVPENHVRGRYDSYRPCAELGIDLGTSSAQVSGD